MSQESAQLKIGKYMIGVGCVMEHTPTGKILCLKRDSSDFQNGDWELMYGRIDQHEELFTALRREVGEETGITEFAIKRLLRVWHFYRGERSADTEIHGFTFHCQTESMDVILSAEHSEYVWLEPTEALKKITVPGIQQDMQFFLDHKDDTSVAFSGLEQRIIPMR